jgi:hypothetical protein
MDTLDVNYIIDGKISVVSTKLNYKKIDEDEYQYIHLEVQLNNHQVKSKLFDSFELAIKYFQKELPDSIKIACCQSCRHGNFNPYGDFENEIFCLKDKTPRSKSDVADIFSDRDQSIETRRRKLLDYCNDYKPISESEKYTYNDWDY